MKLLLDMNLSPDWAPFLSVAGHTAVHWSAVGLPTAPDTEIMNWARANGFIVFTNDLDFSALLAMTRGAGPSVLQVRLQDLMPDAIGGAVLRQHDAAFVEGAIVTLADSGTRVRVLPLRSEPA